MNTIWIEKYRPNEFSEIIGQDKNINMLNKMITNGSLPHLLFHGKSGTGKTSTITSIANKLYGKNKTFMLMRLDASDDRGINTVREEIKGFADKMTPFNNGVKLIVLDEADSMTYDAQFALRRIIEKYSDNTRFCLICNYENKIIPAIKARCVNIRFYPIKKDIIINRLKNICSLEKIIYTNDSLETIASISNGDLRKAINMLQSISMMNNKISSELCYNSTGIPNPCLVQDVFNILIDTQISFETTVDYIKKNIIDEGILLSFLCQQLTIYITDQIRNSSTRQVALQTKDSNMKLLLIIIDMAKLECDVAISTFNDIYIAGLISIFKKYTVISTLQK
jgi:replication factor C subunit 3/5